MPLPRLATRPVASADAVLAGDRWRVTVLTDGLLRLEWADDGVFEDRASALALNREMPVPDFRVVETDRHLEVLTDRLHLVYDRGPFSSSGLTVQVLGGVTTWHSLWRYGAEAAGGEWNLGGTARTLDDVDGPTELEPGVLSRNGYAVLDDSGSPVLEDDGRISPRDGSRTDLYVFAYGHDFRAALRAFYALSGPQPVLPRWALGTWWSRYHPYSAPEYLTLLDRFAAEGVPLSVGVLDMDWHVTDVEGHHGSGWTGYTWNRDLFPDPEGFLAEVHRRGLKVTLNDHPADGVRSFEEPYPAMARAMGLDPASGHPVAFDVADPTFLTAYLEVLHHPLEEQGVDFWWIDWQQGPHSRVVGLDPLWMLNHVHFLDSGRDGRRPMTFSRYAGPGSHRYPVGFSGDAVATWASLDFQVEFTATAANIGYGWWSHDVGGHIGGARDDELATRWVQFGVFSPVTRLHSAASPFTGKEPWGFGPAAQQAMTAALRLRARLVPYLHTMNHRAHDDGVPLVTPMYHEHPDAPQAYEARHQYAFGSELVVAPITAPLDPGTLLGQVPVWLPEGTWVDVLDGTVYDARVPGGRELILHRPFEGIPVLARTGGLVPLDADGVPPNDARNPGGVEVLAVPGADGALTLVEDDGTGPGDDPARRACTPLVWAQASGTLSVGPLEGDAACVPPRRSWTVTFVAAAAGGEASATVDGSPVAATTTVAGRSTSVRVDDVPVGARLTVSLGTDPALAPNDTDGRVFALLHRAQVDYEVKERVLEVLSSPAPLGTRLAGLQALRVDRALETALGELLLAAPGLGSDAEDDQTAGGRAS